MEPKEEVHVESYADEAPLTYLFGNSARVKIIGVFVSERGRDLNVSEIARQAGVARSTVYNNLQPLEDLCVVSHTRDGRDGSSPRYQLNEDSELAELLYHLEGRTLKRLMNSEKF